MQDGCCILPDAVDLAPARVVGVAEAATLPGMQQAFPWRATGLRSHGQPAW